MQKRLSSLAAAVFLLSASGIHAEDKPAKPWANSTEVSVVSANGNTKSATSSAKNKFSYTRSKTTLELEAGALGAKSQGRVTAEKYFASEKVAYKLSERNYMFEKFGWDKDRFAGIRNRYDSSIGLGRELIDRPNDKLIGELGGGYTIEERIGAKTNKFTSGRAYAKYTRTLSPTANFSQDAEYLANFDDKDNFRVNTETALTAALSTHFSLKVGYGWKYVGVPPPGFGRSDTITTVALIANY